MKSGHKFLVGMMIMVAGVAPSWQWSTSHKEFTLGMGRSPLIRWVKRSEIINGFVASEDMSWNVELFSASGGLVFAGILVMANAGRRDDRPMGGHPQPPSPPAN